MYGLSGADGNLEFLAVLRADPEASTAPSDWVRLVGQVTGTSAGGAM
jgi:hypothetical protein